MQTDIAELKQTEVVWDEGRIIRKGTPAEREKPPGQDGGYLWRLNSYWRFLRRDGSDLPWWATHSVPVYLNFRKASIYGGSNEVQRQIIARTILGL